MCEYFRVLTCNITGWAEYVDAYETAMRIKHIQLAEENTFILRDNSHYSGVFTLSDKTLLFLSYKHRKESGNGIIFPLLHLQEMNK